jgi:phospholipase D1/2
VHDSLDFIRFYHLRAYDRINAPLCACSFPLRSKQMLINSFFIATYIQEIEQKGGVKYLEAQVALAKQWIGSDSDGSQKEVGA